MGKRIVLLGLLAASCSSTPAAPPYKAGDPLTIDLAGAFPAGTALRDAYGGSAATVTAAGSVTVTPGASGVVLLERDGAQPSAFSWANATVYFVLTDRFFNGDPSNDASYGRAKDGAQEVGTWHGGDLKGLAQKLDYIAGLGATALWISPIVEQVHGWVSGGDKADFKYYGYTGYWALDFTRLDQNLGNAADLQALVDGAHQRGIRVLLDVVMNHPGYATGDDLLSYLPEVFKDSTGNAFRNFTPGSGGYADWNNLVNYPSPDWQKWWSPAWIRAGLGPPGTFPSGGTSDQTKQLTFLPDFITEGTQTAGVPTLFARKTDTGVQAIPNGTVRDYLVKWHTDWVRQFGIDGFRCDTAKNVEVASWKALKDAAVPALRAWKQANPAKKIDDSDFWMTGEVYGHGVTKDDYFFSGGFDSVINFDFQGAVRDLLTANGSLPAGAAALEPLYARYASAISADASFDVLSYISSHDTRLFYGDIAKTDPVLQNQAGTALLLVPGGAQIFYGDESGRVLGPALSDPVQATRSDMNWRSMDASVLAHWQKLAGFRKRHASVGGGVHLKLTSPAGTYAFSRRLGADDAVVVALTPPR